MPLPPRSHSNCSFSKGTPMGLHAYPSHSAASGASPRKGSDPTAKHMVGEAQSISGGPDTVEPNCFIRVFAITHLGSAGTPCGMPTPVGPSYPSIGSPSLPATALQKYSGEQEPP